MTDTKTILVIDDDPVLIRLIEYNLRQAKFQVITATDGQTGLRQIFEHKPQLAILDINMPGMDGWTTCRRIREVSDMPIIMLTAQNQKENVVKGLELGADDYISKPFDMKELLARIKTNLRRMAVSTVIGEKKANSEYHDGHLDINLLERRVARGNEVIKLTKTEFDLLAELVTISPRVATYRTLLENVWGFEYIDDIDYLRVYIWHLRRKIETDPKSPIYIVNEQGIGYRFEKQTD